MQLIGNRCLPDPAWILGNQDDSRGRNDVVVAGYFIQGFLE